MLYIVATPIGNLEDITLRALRILKDVDIILAEDTRKTGMLLKHFGIKKNLISFHDHNEAKKVPWIISEMKNGVSFALVSSAGTPTISDPGYKLIRACRNEQFMCTSVPGASSIINALALSSIPHDKFIFLGYLPRKKNERKKIFEEIKQWNSAIVFFESPYRVIGAIEDIGSIIGDRRITVAREMTKKFEEIIEGPASVIQNQFLNKKIQGEFTVVIDNRQEGNKNINDQIP